MVPTIEKHTMGSLELALAVPMLLGLAVTACDLAPDSDDLPTEGGEVAITQVDETPPASSDEVAHAAKLSLRGGGFDPAIANKDRLADMLRRDGRVPALASMSEASDVVDDFLRHRSAQADAHGLPVGPQARRLLERQANRMRERKEQALRRGTPLAEASGSVMPERFEATDYDGQVLEPRLLSLLVEFPDFPHNSITPDETAMYYADYSPAHYEDLLFSRDVYEGPNGEALRTARNWYWAQSGHSYDLDGVVAGWYTASEPAEFYGGNAATGNDVNPRQLVHEAVLQLAASTDLDLNQFDKDDPYDLDGDGDVHEPDGIIDHLLVFHSSVGEEAGGGSLGEDAIWSHRWVLPAPLPLPGTETGLPYWGGQLVAFGYTMQPADAAVGVVVHEHGHDIGLPDEYDTQYTGAGEPVGLWSTMSSGSWAGEIPGSKPTGMSAYARETLQTQHGGNWMIGGRVDALDLDRFGTFVLLDQASSKGRNHDYVRVDLPPKMQRIITPPAGDQAYHSGAGDNLNNTMTYALDLTAATDSAQLQFQAWFDIEAGWDYAYVRVDDGSGVGPVSVASTITTDENPNGTNLGNGITGVSDWTTAEFDLSAYLGQQIEVSILYQTDGAVTNPGIYLDALEFVVDDQAVATDGAEDGEQIFVLDGFYPSDGTVTTDHYYLLEWRSYHDVDAGLAERMIYGGQLLRYNRGLVVWYVDESFTDNWVGLHPGQGFLGVVDADQRPLAWNSAATGDLFGYGSTLLQIRDAAFSLRRSPRLELDVANPADPEDTLHLEDSANSPRASFRDWRSYWSEETVPHAGRKIESYGLSFEVWFETRDRSVALIRLARRDRP